jgi:hypothetical protein
MVMDAGLKYLSQQATLPADERHIIEEINNFQGSPSSTKPTAS